MVSVSATYHSSTTHVGQLQRDVETAREASFDESALNKMRAVNRTVLTTACAEMVQGDPQHRRDRKAKSPLCQEEDRAGHSSGLLTAKWHFPRIALQYILSVTCGPNEPEVGRQFLSHSPTTLEQVQVLKGTPK